MEVGLHQGSALSPYLSLILVDVLTEGVRKEVPDSMMFADDIVLCGGREVDMTEYLDTWRKSLEERGMRLSRPKTQFMDFNFEQNQEGNREPVKILGEELERVTHFKYLGTSMEEEGGMETEITKRVGAGWRNWKKCSGVLCDRRMPVKLKGKVYKTVIRPAMLYGAETWAVKATKLQLYYGRALRSNVGNADATRDAVWATLFHSTSTDADPHHTRCPRGLDSWCCFNKSVALGLPMPQHNPRTVGTMLDRDVTFKLVPIYERMTDDNLLVRMTTGGTQNANESLNSLIWLYCPKTQFVGHRTVVSAVQSAVARFNGGATATTERLLCLGVQPTEMQIACMLKEDDRRVKRAEKAADNATKLARKSRQSAQKRALAELEAGEGVQYAAGAF